MPKNDDRPAPPNPAVRRASVLPTVAAEPGSALDRFSAAPGASAAKGEGRGKDGGRDGNATTGPAGGKAAVPPTVGGEPTASAGSAAGTGRTTPADGPAPASAASGEATSGTAAAEADASDTSGPASGTAPERTAKTRSSDFPSQAASEAEAPMAMTMPTAAAAAVAPADAKAARTATAGRPNKPLLAAAAIAGTVLLGVPFLFLGPGADDDPPAGSDRAQPVGGTVLEGGGPDDAQGYAAAPPASSPTASATPSPEKPETSEKSETSAKGEKSEAAPEAAPEKKDEAVERPRSAPPAPPSSGSPERTEKKPAAAAVDTAVGRGLPQGPNFSTVTDVLIKNVMTGMCVDIGGYGNGKVNGPVNQFTCRRSGDNQLWDLVVTQKGAGPSGADLFMIRNSKDGYCLDLGEYGSRPARTPVSEFHCNGTLADNQLWYLDKKSDGKFWIRNHVSADRCLDVAGYYGSGGKDARLTIFDCDLKDDHLWSFS